MSKKNSNFEKSVINDINKTIDDLRKKGLLRDENGISTKTGRNSIGISFSGKSETSSIMFDKYISSSCLIDALLKDRQYTFLLYDKSIVQAEFHIEDGMIRKERLVFIKKHNRKWNMEEIAAAEADDEDWFSEEEGIPILLRIDFDDDSSKYVPCEHPISHLTLSNSESCRIPIKNAISFSDFISFVLWHFYSIKLDISVLRFEQDCSISDIEKKMIHINWVSER